MRTVCGQRSTIDGPSPGSKTLGPESTAAPCRNCGATSGGAYCAACGQSIDTRIPSLWGVIAAVLDGFFNFDSRLWRTLIPLVVRPGLLTNEYLGGRRARYLPPFRLYLVLSLLYFVLAALLTGPAEPMPAMSDAATPPAPGQRCEWVQNVLPEGSALTDRTYAACTRVVADQGQSFNREFADRVPLLIFIMIPLFAGGLKLVYLGSGRKFVEHLFFLFHLHALTFLVLTVGALITAASRALAPGSGIPVLLLAPLWLYLPYYGYRALRNVYGQGRLVTIVKYALIALGYLILVTLTLLLGVAYTAFTL